MGLLDLYREISDTGELLFKFGAGRTDSHSLLVLYLIPVCFSNQTPVSFPLLNNVGGASMQKLLAICISLLVVLGVSTLKPSLAADEKSGTQEKKVRFIAIYDDKCQWSCGVVKPLVEGLKKDYGDKVSFYELNTSKAKMSGSTKLAKELGVEQFFTGSMAYIPCVGVFSKNGKLVKEIPAAKPKETYVKFIDKALASKD